MTQFQSPPPPPGLAGAYGPVRGGLSGQAPWSKAAVAGFVCSLLGCLGVTALLGFLFGIIGLAKTSGGRRRGRGLAIAAIPISLVMGVVFAFGGYLGLATARFLQVPKKLQTILKTDTGSFESTATELRKLTSAEFNESVSSEQLTQWLAAVRTKHGSLNKLAPGGGKPIDRSGDQAVMRLNGQFVNGNVPVEIRFVPMAGLDQILIDDLEIDGVSPRSSNPQQRDAVP